MADELDSFIPFLSVLKLFLLYRKEQEKAFDCFTHVVSLPVGTVASSPTDYPHSLLSFSCPFSYLTLYQ